MKKSDDSIRRFFSFFFYCVIGFSLKQQNPYVADSHVADRRRVNRLVIAWKSSQSLLRQLVSTMSRISTSVKSNITISKVRIESEID